MVSGTDTVSPGEAPSFAAPEEGRVGGSLPPNTAYERASYLVGSTETSITLGTSD